METRRAFLAQLRDSIDRIERKLREIEVEARSRRIEAESGYHEATGKLRSELHRVRARLVAASEAPGGVWEDARAGLDRAGEQLKAAFADVYRSFKRAVDLQRAPERA